MENFVESLQEHMTPEDVATLEACMDCKNCGQACAWYLTTDDEKLHPHHKMDFMKTIYKRYMTAEGKVGGALGIHDTPTEEDLREQMEYFWKCTACGRCTLSCPQGLSIRRIVRIARIAYDAAGLNTENETIKSIVENTEEYRHSFGLTPEQLFGRMSSFFHASQVEVPLEVENAEYLFVCPSAGNTKTPDLGVKVPQILNAAGVSYTVTPKVTDTGTEIDHVAVDEELSRELLIEWEEEAERLGAEKILVMECGCDTRTMHAEADDTLGRPFKFPFISVDRVILDQIQSGNLPVEKVDDRVTMHDPCYVTRLSGNGDMERELLNSVAENFVEMQPNGEQNYCCNGGAGPMRLPENDELRRDASVIKANQIEETGADFVATPCAVCSLSLTDTVNTYDLADDDERMVRMMYEFVYDAVTKALEERGELDRLQTPAELEGVDEDYYREHTSQGYLMDLIDDGRYADVKEWMEGQDFVARYKRENPEAADRLEELYAMTAEDDVNWGDVKWT